MVEPFIFFSFFLAFPLLSTNIVHLLNRKNFSMTCFLREKHKNMSRPHFIPKSK